MNPIGKQIKQVRDRFKLTQAQLADEIGVKPSYISKLENNKKEPSLLFVKAVCLRFDLTENWLLTGKGEIAVPEEKPKEEHEQERHLRRIGDRTGEGNTREGILSLFQDRETVRQMLLKLVEIEKDREHFLAVKIYVQAIFDSMNIKKSA